MISSNFKNSIRLDRQRLEFVYSVLLVVLIPIIFAASTLFFINEYRDNLDRELRKRSDSINRVVDSSLASVPDDQVANYLDSVVSEIDDLSQLFILRPSQTGSFEAIYTTQSDELDTVIYRQAGLALNTGESVSTLTVSRETNERVWQTFSPSTNDSTLVIGSQLGLASSDQIAQATFNRSIIALIVAVVIVVLLQLNHMKFVQYAVLFKKLKELDQMKSDFLNVASHELKAPLSIIRGHVSMILDGDLGKIPPKAKESLTTVMRSTTHLVHMVEDLLNVSRIEDGRIEYNLENVNLHEILNPLIEQYRLKAKEKSLSIKYEPNDALWVKADRGKCQEIFTNLIDNAVKYSLEGQIVVSSELANGLVVTKVRDRGIGMSAEEQKQLFKRFSRIKNDDTASIRGTGLGLWIIKQYIEAMQGKIEVESIKGEGSQFSVHLPATKA